MKLNHFYVVTDPEPGATFQTLLTLTTPKEHTRRVVGHCMLEGGEPAWEALHPVIYTEPEEAHADAVARWVAAGRRPPKSDMKKCFTYAGTSATDLINDLLGEHSPKRHPR